MAIKNQFSIKELEALSGIKAHTIRIWEQRYNLLNPKRTDTNIRLYDIEDLRLLLNIAFLYENGHKISRIAKMQDGEIYEKVIETAETDTSFTNQLRELKISMIEMDEAKFEKIIGRCSIQFGFSGTMENIIFPFLQIVGLDWMTNNIHPAQEHFISSLIRQKIIIAIDGQEMATSPNAQRFLLFLPEDETHELGLLYLNYLLRKHQKKTLYLGYSVPMGNLISVATQFEPDYLYTIITSPTVNDGGLKGYLDQLSSRFRDITVLVSGAQTLKTDLSVPPNIHLIRDMASLHTLLSQPEFSVWK